MKDHSSRSNPVIEKPGKWASPVLKTVDDPFLGFLLFSWPGKQVIIVEVSFSPSLDARSPLWPQIQVTSHIFMLIEEAKVAELTLNDVRLDDDVSNLLRHTVWVLALRVVVRAVIGQALGHDLEEACFGLELRQLIVKHRVRIKLNQLLDLLVDLRVGLKPKLKWEVDVLSWDSGAVSLESGELRQAERVRSRVVVQEHELDSLCGALVLMEIDTRAEVVLKEVPALHVLEAHVGEVVHGSHAGAWELQGK